MASARMGEQVASALLDIGFGLSRCWEHAPFKAKREGGILDQEVDKFSLLLVHAMSHADIRKAPFRVLPGRRGPGVALISSASSPIYICDIIEDFQARMPKEHCLFAIRRAGGVARYFEPLVSPVDWDRWKNRALAGSPGEGDFLTGFSTVIQGFERAQVIALGRHPNKDVTASSLRKLISDFRAEFESMLAKWRTGDDSWPEQLREGLEIAEVGFEKVTLDRDAYNDARKVVAKCDNVAAKAILGCRGADYEIWEAETVTQLVPQTLVNYRLSRVVRASIGCWAKKEGRAEIAVGAQPDRDLQLSTAEWDANYPSLTSVVDMLLEGRFESCSALLGSRLKENRAT